MTKKKYVRPRVIRGFLVEDGQRLRPDFINGYAGISTHYYRKAVVW